MIACPNCRGEAVGVIGHIVNGTSKIEVTCFSCGFMFFVEKKVGEGLKCTKDFL